MNEQPPASVTTADPRLEQVIEDALRGVWAVANTLARVKPSTRHRYRVTVFGSARIRAGQALYEQVKELARALAQRGCDVVTGGGPGVMQAANEGAQLGDPQDEVTSIGVRIDLPFEQAANPFVEQGFTHETFYTRLHDFVRLSNAFVVVGGGIGTALETLLVWQLLQVGHLHDVPLVFVGPMWQALRDWATEHMLRHEPPLCDARDVAIPVCVATVDEALAVLGPHLDAYRARRARTP